MITMIMYFDYIFYISLLKSVYTVESVAEFLMIAAKMVDLSHCFEGVVVVLVVELQEDAKGSRKK